VRFLILALCGISYGEIVPILKYDFVSCDKSKGDITVLTKSNNDSSVSYVQLKIEQQSRSKILRPNVIRLFESNNDTLSAAFGPSYGKVGYQLLCNLVGKLAGKKYRMELSVMRDTVFEFNGLTVSINSAYWNGLIYKLNPVSDIKFYQPPKATDSVLKSKCETLQYVRSDSAKAEIISIVRWHEIGRKQLSAMYRFPFMKSKIPCNDFQSENGNTLAFEADPNDVDEIFSTLSKPRREISLFDEGDTAGFDLTVKIDDLPSNEPNFIYSGNVFINDLLFSVAKRVPLNSNKITCDKFRYGQLCWEVKRTKKFKK